MSRYNRFSHYIRDRFGERVQRIVLDAGFTCPNRDGSLGGSGCIYCNNTAFSPALAKSDQSLTEQLNSQIAYAKRRFRGVSKFIAYLQPYSNTYGSFSKLRRVLDEVLVHPQVVGVAIATRPDCVDAEKLDYLAYLAKRTSVLLEYGIESWSDKTLKLVRRGHTVADSERTLRETIAREIPCGAHLIIGLPWESLEDWRLAVRKLSELGVGFVKFHHLTVVKGTDLAKLYEHEPFPMLTPEEYLETLVDLLEHLSPNVVVQRLFGEVQYGTALVREWMQNGSSWTDRLERRLEAQNSYQGRLYTI